MNLHDYAESTGIKDKDLADMIGCSRGYITMLRLGIRKRPSLPVAFKIEKVTGGKVPVKVWGLA